MSGVGPVKSFNSPSGIPLIGIGAPPQVGRAVGQFVGQNVEGIISGFSGVSFGGDRLQGVLAVKR